MWNKKYLLVIFVFLLAWSLSAQTYSRRRSRNRRPAVTVPQTIQTDRKTDTEKPAKSGNSAKSSQSKKNDRRPGFDPSKPGISQAYVDGITGELRKQLLERKLSTRLPKRKGEEEDDGSEDASDADKERKKEKFTTVTQTDFRIYTSRYRDLVNHFELEEVTGIRRDWYKRFLAEVDKFEPTLVKMSMGLRRRSVDYYQNAVREFERRQKVCLDFLATAKNYRLNKDQLVALKDQNIKIRKQNHLKYLEQKRRAAMKRQQEQLKQLQQKNQQNQKPAQGGAK